MKTRSVWLVTRALFELIRYDVAYALGGFRGVTDCLSDKRSSVVTSGAINSSEVCAAVVLATCLYWKPVRCLQRSVCMVRLLRGYGVAAKLVIGYRAVPFFSHAWVEIDGRIVNDSPSYQQRLHVLYTS